MRQKAVGGATGALIVCVKFCKSGHVGWCGIAGTRKVRISRSRRIRGHAHGFRKRPYVEQRALHLLDDAGESRDALGVILGDLFECGPLQLGVDFGEANPKASRFALDVDRRRLRSSIRPRRLGQGIHKPLVLGRVGLGLRALTARRGPDLHGLDLTLPEGANRSERSLFGALRIRKAGELPARLRQGGRD